MKITNNIVDNMIELAEISLKNFTSNKNVSNIHETIAFKTFYFLYQLFPYIQNKKNVPYYADPEAIINNNNLGQVYNNVYINKDTFKLLNDKKIVKELAFKLYGNEHFNITGVKELVYHNRKHANFIKNLFELEYNFDLIKEYIDKNIIPKELKAWFLPSIKRHLDAYYNVMNYYADVGNNENEISTSLFSLMNVFLTSKELDERSKVITLDALDKYLSNVYSLKESQIKALRNLIKTVDVNFQKYTNIDKYVNGNFDEALTEEIYYKIVFSARSIGGMNKINLLNNLTIKNSNVKKELIYQEIEHLPKNRGEKIIIILKDKVDLDVLKKSLNTLSNVKSSCNKENFLEYVNIAKSELPLGVSIEEVSYFNFKMDAAAYKVKAHNIFCLANIIENNCKDFFNFNFMLKKSINDKYSSQTFLIEKLECTNQEEVMLFKDIMEKIIRQDSISITKVKNMIINYKNKEDIEKHIDDIPIKNNIYKRKL